MTYSYYKLTLQCTVNKGTTNEHQYDVIRYSMTPEYNDIYSTDTVVTSSELIETNDQCVILDGWNALLFGRMFGISEEHSGRYVFLKSEWDKVSDRFDQSIKDAMIPFDWDDYDWLENDGNEYVVFDLGGQLQLPDEDGYWRSIEDEVDLPELFDYLPINWDLSDVGNG